MKPETGLCQLCRQRYQIPQVILFTEDEGSEVAELRSEFTAIYDMKMQFIMGEMDIDAEWDSYIRQLEQQDLIGTWN